MLGSTEKLEFIPSKALRIQIRRGIKQGATLSVYLQGKTYPVRIRAQHCELAEDGTIKSEWKANLLAPGEYYMILSLNNHVLLQHVQEITIERDEQMLHPKLASFWQDMNTTAILTSILVGK